MYKVFIINLINYKKKKKVRFWMFVKWYSKKIEDNGYLEAFHVVLIHFDAHYKDLLHT